MKSIINIIGFLIIVGGAASLGFLIGRTGGVKVENSVPPFLPTIQEIQERIGCEKIDGIWGPETDKLYEHALCNQYAAEYFEGEQE